MAGGDRPESGGFPFDIAREQPLAPAGDDWWQPMSDAEADDWIEGESA